MIGANFVKSLLGALMVAGLLGVFVITREGALVTPEGQGQVKLDSGVFEAFALPDYAARLITRDYKSYLVEVEPGIKIHVLEVGSGYPVYLQHGNPTSGFLYRKIAAELKNESIRLIMPTMVGLGFSSKIPSQQHTLDNHMHWMGSVLAQLQLESLVYVGQDWGGPVGMGALTLNPGLLKGAVILNTGFNAPQEAANLSVPHALAKTPILGELLLEVLVSMFERLPNMQGEPNSMPPEVLKLYEQPVIDSGNRKAPLTLMRMVTDGPDHPSAAPMRIIEDYAASLDIPAEIVWGMNDPILAKALPTVRAIFPEASVIETSAGHFLQEEVPGEIAEAVMRVVTEVKGLQE